MPLTFLRRITNNSGLKKSGSSNVKEAVKTQPVSKTDDWESHVQEVKTYHSKTQDLLLQTQVEFEERYNGHFIPQGNINQYSRLKAIGSGAFGTVFLLQKNGTDEYNAMKVMSKQKIVQSSQVEHIFNEKRILCSIKFPFLINMIFFNTDNSYLYFILPFVNGGEMFGHLRRENKYSEEQAKFYAAQVLLSLEYLHFMNIAYRDLKPENILFDENGYIKITDMGFCKKVCGITWTLCGTPEYMAPEILMNRGYNKSVDWWSLGILVYEMCAGYTPFSAESHWKTYEKILETRLRFPTAFREKRDLVDLLKKLIQKDLTQRYGNLKNGVLDIKIHPWFASIDWAQVYHKQVPAPYEPKKLLKGLGDVHLFDYTPEPKMEIADHVEYELEFRDL